MTTRHNQLADEVERAAIDVQALSQRLSVQAPRIAFRHHVALRDAARSLCMAAEVLHGHRTETLRLFFGDEVPSLAVQQARGRADKVTVSALDE